MKYIYKVDEKNQVRVWNTENPNEKNLPFIYQPVWPDGTPFENKEQAEAYAQLVVESCLNPNSEYITGPSPDEPKRLRPEPVEIDPKTGLPVKSVEAEA